MNDNFISSGITNILLNGINLKLESLEEEQHYIAKMLEYFEDKTDFLAYLRGDRIIEIENENMILTLELRIYESVLYLIPHMDTDEIFEIFTEVLKFISSKHTEVMNECRGTEETKIESPDEVNRIENNQKTDEKETTREEPNSDDDFEWI